MAVEKTKKNKTKAKSVTKQKLKQSSLESTFLERPLPGDEDVSRFEDLVEKEIILEETDANLSAIYSDNKGKPVDVSQVKKRKKTPIITFFKRAFVLTILLSAAYGVYTYYFSGNESGENFNFYINAPERVVLGEEFNYEIVYENSSTLTLNQASVELITPDSLVILETNPELGEYKKLSIGTIMPGEKGSLIIKAYLIAPTDSANVLSARLSYIPSNFSSEFKKEASVNTIISSLGIMVNIDYLNTALVGRANELKFNISGFNREHSNLSEIYLDINTSDNFEFKKKNNKDAAKPVKNPKQESEESEDLIEFEELGEHLYLITKLPGQSSQRFSLPISFSFKEKLAEQEELSFRLFKKTADNKELTFWEKTLSFDLVKSDLNIELVLNDLKNDQALDFGSELNYSLSYTNNGEAALFDLVLMAVIKGDFVDWASLGDPLGGSIAGNAIIWTKENLPALAEVDPGQSGKINFNLRLKDFSLANLSNDNKIISYAQYGLNSPIESDSEDSRSNTITSQLNSDLSLTEKVLYFNEDNLPVGSGPLPPQVGDKTSVRVAWTVKNNLHDLEGTEVIMTLAQGVSWDEQANTNVGKISYNEEDRTVHWRLGYLPLSVYRADAEFNISITPTENDRDKILILSPGSIVKAIDTKTKAEISQKTKAKTTKLEDDEIAGLSSNGRVE